MNPLIKEAALSTGTSWSAVVALLLFFGTFLSVLVWTWRQSDTPPELE